MKTMETGLEGCLLIHPRIYEDKRGCFYESYRKNAYEEALGRSLHFIQDNISTSRKGVLRGLHFQKGDFAQAKLVRVLHGAVLDVVLDLRPESPTFGRHFKTKISADGKESIFIPRGMAHGFVSLVEGTVFLYKCDNYYDPDSEAGIRYDDPDLTIDWEYPKDELILSNKDLELPYFKQLFR